MPSINAETWETVDGFDSTNCKPLMAAGALLRLPIRSCAMAENALLPDFLLPNQCDSKFEPFVSKGVQREAVSESCSRRARWMHIPTITVTLGYAQGLVPTTPLGLDSEESRGSKSYSWLSKAECRAV